MTYDDYQPVFLCTLCVAKRVAARKTTRQVEGGCASQAWDGLIPEESLCVCVSAIFVPVSNKRIGSGWQLAPPSSTPARCHLCVLYRLLTCFRKLCNFTVGYFFHVVSKCLRGLSLDHFSVVNYVCMIGTTLYNKSDAN
jgi:hypothetical protein